MHVPNVYTPIQHLQDGLCMENMHPNPVPIHTYRKLVRINA